MTSITDDRAHRQGKEGEKRGREIKAFLEIRRCLRQEIKANTVTSFHKDFPVIPTVLPQDSQVEEGRRGLSLK